MSPLPLSNRTALVTGASAGIGKEVARGQARLGARVVMACRSRERGEAARSEIVAEGGNDSVEVEVVDLASQGSIRSFASAFLAAHPSLDVLVNNAGIWSRPRQETDDGIELTWATNVLGYFLLTELLIPGLRRAASARVVNVASEYAGGMDLDDVEFRRRRYDGGSAYSQSKQADRMLTWALARRLDGTGVTANAMHPGVVLTGMLRGAMGPDAMGRTPEEGADTVVWLASSPEVDGVSGRFWIDRRERSCRFRDPAAEEALWELCGSMVSRSAAYYK